jgi:predicted nucleic acid-binding protein
MRRYLSGVDGRDVNAVDLALESEQAAVAPVVVTELLSELTLQSEARALLPLVDLLRLEPGYWERAGELRARLLKAGRKANLADCLIAQACIDNDAPLITYDRDFRHFESAGLKLI